MPDDLSAEASFLGWAPLIGEWKLGGSAAYVPPVEPEPAIGLLLAPGVFQSGLVSVDVTFPESAEPLPQARIVFGFDPGTNAFYSAGLGGYNSLYVLEQFAPAAGGQTTGGAIRTQGKPVNLHRDETYSLSVSLAGQWMSLWVDGVLVVQQSLPGPLSGWQHGLTAWGRGPVEFGNYQFVAEEPTAFVVMQFGESYNALYRDVIEPVAKDSGFRAVRADDVFGPGIVLEDIITGIREASVIVAEISPANANVFYELGYAHATDKPTILLAERGHSLPFDVAGYRCIFYDNSIAGRSR